MLQYAFSIEIRMLGFYLQTSQVLGVASGWVMLKYSRKINNEWERRQQKITTQLYEIQQQYNFTVLISYKWLCAALDSLQASVTFTKGSICNESKTKPKKQQPNQRFVWNKEWLWIVGDSKHLWNSKSFIW